MSDVLTQWIESKTRPQLMLVVDDEEIVRWAFAANQQAFNVRMDYAATAKEAVDAIHGCKYDYIFLDMALERLTSGMEVLQMINSAQPDATVVIMSGSVSLHDIMHEANRLGVLSFIRKPVEFTPAYLFQIFKRMGLQPTGLLPAKRQLQVA